MPARRSRTTVCRISSRVRSETAAGAASPRAGPPGSLVMITASRLGPHPPIADTSGTHAPAPAYGEPCWHQRAGPGRHERHVRLVLDLLNAVEDERGPGVPVEAEAPQLGQHTGIRGVAPIHGQLDCVAVWIAPGEPLHSPDLMRGAHDVGDRDVEVGDPG